MVAQDVKYGLAFNSFEVVQEKRTGLNLTPSEPFSFPNGFSLSFDICFRSNSGFNYGYVFRMIGQNEQHVDFLLNETNLLITHSLGKTIAVFSFNEINYTRNTYFPFEIQFDIENSTLNITLKDKKVSTQMASMKDFKEVNIVFGKCSYPQFQVSDVPKMSIKDIRIHNRQGDTVRFWPLSKHIQKGVFDELKKQLASAENPQWILDSHAVWKKQISFDTKYNPQIAYNQDKSSVAIFDQASFYSYNLPLHSLQKEKLAGEIPENYYTNQTGYNPLTHAYYSYLEVKDDIITYDTITNSWNSIRDKERTNAWYWHHNKFISPFDSCLYVFGGYGHHKYNSAIHKYDFKTQSWEELHFNGDQIQPRYLSGLGVLDEHRMLIFGGYGSETGAQELSPQNYYDLYVVDIKEMTVKKLWELTPPKDNFVVANSLVVDTLNKCFYALCFPQQLYNTSLFLGKFSMERPGYEILADTIPFAFQDIYSYADLFLNKKTDELIAISSSPAASDSTATVSIYSLTYPPLSAKDLYQKEKKHGLSGSGMIIFLFILSGLCGGMVYYFKKRKNIKQEMQNSPTIPDLPPDRVESNESSKTRIDKRAIFLFGGFRVIDKDGRDVTGEFSPLSKQLFLIILLNTLKGGKGIASLKLRETLWFDKTQESARNNRGVILSRLRHIFEQVGMITIDNKNSHWTIELGDDVYCDYYEAITLMKRLKNDVIPNNKDVHELLLIVSAGGMLPNLQLDWIDSFKADFSNDLIDTLLYIVQHPHPKLSPQNQIDLADAIFIHDSLNEDALKIKCKTLFNMGKNGLAKDVYTSFVKEYDASFGSKFKYSFDQIVS
ncbi:hypothetical protein FACS189421_05050 [Bacteroidia bacterium]|nr:hypothetical protein FACS189421_05050 [Bacteroidia bacterium]GHT02842.1 hypothetical protein FACS189423_02380 [Bacteroidia bacterium]GHT49490.1 hypothetical protein FACS189440_15330 [Bacteroidia bacterium]